MKYLFILLLFSCSKIKVEQCKSVVYLIDRYSDGGKLLKTDTAAYWPNVCGEELKRFQAMSKEKEIICNTNDSLYLVIK